MDIYNASGYFSFSWLTIERSFDISEIPDQWEQELIDNTNHAITAYNDGREEKKKLKRVNMGRL